MELVYEGRGFKSDTQIVSQSEMLYLIENDLYKDNGLYFVMDDEEIIKEYCNNISLPLIFKKSK